MGVTTETEAPGYEPHDVNITFEKRYGVCRDKAALLAAMLRLADIPAYMTLFYAGAPKDSEVPNNYFNHAVVAAELPGIRGYVLMDPTDENSSELLPAYGANKSYLVARKEGDTGSPEVQIALLTARIVHLTEHLKRNRKDYSTQTGLLALVNRRKKLLAYLARENYERYVSLCAELGIRRK